MFLSPTQQVQAQFGDFYSLTTYDGQVLEFPNQAGHFIEVGGFGMPPVNWITKQGYRQHGETEVGYILGRRQISLHLHYNPSYSRAQYWQNRALLIDFLRHNRSGPLTLTVQLPGDSAADVSSYSPSGQTLLGNMASADITFSVSSSYLFAVGMYLRIDQEYMQIASVNNLTGVVTVSRGRNNSSKAAHSASAPIYYSPFSVTSRLRSITVRADPGLTLNTDSAREAHWHIDEALSFTAFNPIWYDPVAQVQTSAANVASQLVFPITFPITFALSGASLPMTIAYAGSWDAYPTLMLSGPYTSCYVLNTTTGVSFLMSVAIAAGQQRIITTTPGSLGVVDQSGNNAFGDLGPGSNLTDFKIKAAPEATGGLNAFLFQFYGGGSGTQASLSYNPQFIGI